MFHSENDTSAASYCKLNIFLTTKSYTTCYISMKRSLIVPSIIIIIIIIMRNYSSWCTNFHKFLTHKVELYPCCLWWFFRPIKTRYFFFIFFSLKCKYPSPKKKIEQDGRTIFPFKFIKMLKKKVLKNYFDSRLRIWMTQDIFKLQLNDAFSYFVPSNYAYRFTIIHGSI